MLLIEEHLECPIESLQSLLAYKEFVSAHPYKITLSFVVESLL